MKPSWRKKPGFEKRMCEGRRREWTTAASSSHASSG
jgi:hypothetical protein